MHFLMPHVFQSHREFKEWFSNPLTGMIEGSQEYNEGLVKRLHKVLTVQHRIYEFDLINSIWNAEKNGPMFILWSFPLFILLLL